MLCCVHPCLIWSFNHINNNTLRLLKVQRTHAECVALLDCSDFIQFFIWRDEWFSNLDIFFSLFHKISSLKEKWFSWMWMNVRFYLILDISPICNEWVLIQHAKSRMTGNEHFWCQLTIFHLVKISPRMAFLEKKLSISFEKTK